MNGGVRAVHTAVHGWAGGVLSMVPGFVFGRNDAAPGERVGHGRVVRRRHAGRRGRHYTLRPDTRTRARVTELIRTSQGKCM